jgi:hypothetical protein
VSKKCQPYSEAGFEGCEIFIKIVKGGAAEFGMDLGSGVFGHGLGTGGGGGGVGGDVRNGEPSRVLLESATLGSTPAEICDEAGALCGVSPEGMRLVVHGHIMGLEDASPGETLLDHVSGAVKLMHEQGGGSRILEVCITAIAEARTRP